ncbi:MAG: response regulator [Myxococcales bacterium]|nr:MAG: response regulator [Myxococcales bacterium]
MARILIARESPQEKQFFAVALRRLGHEAVFADDGEEAEQLLYESRPDLVVVDAAMPGQGGYQFCRTVKSSAEFHTTPIILLASRARESDRWWAVRQGADAVVSATRNAQTVLDAILRFVRVHDAARTQAAK